MQELEDAIYNRVFINLPGRQSGRTASRITNAIMALLRSHVAAEKKRRAIRSVSRNIAELALGDALAVALSERAGFSRQDFAQLHPGGSLGKRLRATRKP